MTYKFPQFNVELTDPELLVSADNITIFPSNMTIDVDIILTVGTSRFGIRLTDIKVENLNYDADTLITSILIRLEDFKV